MVIDGGNTCGERGIKKISYRGPKQPGTGVHREELTKMIEKKPQRGKYRSGKGGKGSISRKRNG